MRSCVIALVAFIGLQPLQAEEKEPIKIELKEFTFKVAETVPEGLVGYNEGENKLFFYTNGTATASVKIPAEGKCEIVVEASCDPAMDERAKFKLMVDEEEVGKETLLTADEAKEYKFPAKLKAGERKVAIQFTNDVHKEGEFDRNFYVHSVSIKPAE